MEQRNTGGWLYLCLSVVFGVTIGYMIIRKLMYSMIDAGLNIDVMVPVIKSIFAFVVGLGVIGLAFILICIAIQFKPKRQR